MIFTDNSSFAPFFFNREGILLKSVSPDMLTLKVSGIAAW
jgi:hypothetical protein